MFAICLLWIISTLNPHLAHTSLSRHILHWSPFSFKKDLFYLLIIYWFLASLGLCCCMRAFSSSGKRGLLSSCGMRAFHCGGVSCCGVQTLRTQASVVAAHRLYSAGSVIVLDWLSCSRAREIFLDQGSNALAGGFLTTRPPGKPSLFC